MARVHRDDLIFAEIPIPDHLILERSMFGEIWTREVGPNDFVSLMEVGVALHVHRVTIYDWIKKGLLKTHESECGARLRWGDVYRFARKPRSVSPPMWRFEGEEPVRSPYNAQQDP